MCPLPSAMANKINSEGERRIGRANPLPGQRGTILSHIGRENDETISIKFKELHVDSFLRSAISPLPLRTRLKKNHLIRHEVHHL